MNTYSKTKYFPYAMIAVGSLNVNGITIIKKDHYKKGDIGGYFNLGSSMLLCFPKNFSVPTIKIGKKIDIGQTLINLKKII